MKKLLLSGLLATSIFSLSALTPQQEAIKDVRDSIELVLECVQAEGNDTNLREEALKSSFIATFKNADFNDPKANKAIQMVIKYLQAEEADEELRAKIVNETDFIAVFKRAAAELSIEYNL